MPSWAEVLGDGTIGGEEALGVPGRLEMLPTFSRADGSTELPQQPEPSVEHLQRLLSSQVLGPRKAFGMSPRRGAREGSLRVNPAALF
jgi:hypothetical protein